MTDDANDLRQELGLAARPRFAAGPPPLAVDLNLIRGLHRGDLSPEAQAEVEDLIVYFAEWHEADKTVLLELAKHIVDSDAVAISDARPEVRRAQDRDIPARGRRFTFQITLAAAALILVTLGVGVWWNQTTRPVAMLHDGDRWISVSRTGEVDGLGEFSADWRQRASSVLKGERFVRSPKTAGLLSNGAGVRGSEQSALLAPIATLVESRRPTFRWRPHSQAKHYRIVVVDDQTQIELSSDATQETELEFPHSLESGRSYTWYLAALIGEQEQFAPAQGKPRPKFSTATTEEKATLARLREELHGSHLLLGIAYVEHGFLDDAEREFEELVSENPTSDMAQLLLRNARAIRTSSK